jgi:hypothetical protein
LANTHILLRTSHGAAGTSEFTVLSTVTRDSATFANQF